MKNWMKYVALALVFCMVVAFAACAGTEEETTAGGGAETTTPAAAGEVTTAGGQEEEPTTVTEKPTEPETVPVLDPANDPYVNDPF